MSLSLPLVEAFFRTGNIVGDHDAVEVVVLVLDNARSDAWRSVSSRSTQFSSKYSTLTASGRSDRLADTGNGQAPLLHGRLFSGFVEEDGIDHDPFEILAPDVAVLAFPERGAIDDEQPNGLSDLGRGQPDLPPCTWSPTCLQ